MTNGWHTRGKRRPPNDGASWSARELRALRALAKTGVPTGQVAKKLGRTAAAVQEKAMRAGISFRAAKRSSARQKKKSAGARRKKQTTSQRDLRPFLGSLLLPYGFI